MNSTEVNQKIFTISFQIIKESQDLKSIKKSDYSFLKECIDILLDSGIKILFDLGFELFTKIDKNSDSYLKNYLIKILIKKKKEAELELKKLEVGLF